MTGKNLFITLLILLFCKHINAQTWKEYRDSAFLYKQQNKIEKAIEFYKAAKNILAPDSLQTITYTSVCDSLGMLYWQKKSYVEAENEFAICKDIADKIAGRNYNSYTRATENMALLYMEQKKFVIAEPLLLEVREIKRKLLGTEHPSYLQTCNRLADLYGNSGNFARAEVYFKEVKETREKVLGKNHPDYIESCDILGTVYAMTGQFEPAASLFLEVKSFKEKEQGKMSPDYAETLNMLASVYTMMGENEKAESLRLEMLQVTASIFGKEHLQYATGCNSLAVLYKDMGQYEKALPYFIQSRSLFAKIIGMNNPEYAEACNSLGALYLTMGRYLESEMLFIETKNIREKILGKTDPAYAASCSNLGAVYRDMGPYEKAKSLYFEAMDICKKTIGTENESYVLSCNNLAILYAGINEYEKAELLFIEAKQIREVLSGKESPEYSFSCNNLSNFYRELGQYAKAETLNLEAIQVLEKKIGVENIQYATTISSLGILYSIQKQYEKAEPLFLEAKRIWEKILGKEHPDYAGSCDRLGNIYSNTGQNEKAEALFKEALLINEKTMGKESPAYAINCTNLAVLYWKLGKYERSEPLLLEANKILEKNFGKNNLNYNQSLNNLGNLYWTLGQAEKANTFYKSSFENEYENVRKIFQFSSEKEKYLYLKEVAGLSDSYFSFYASAYPISKQGFAYDVSLINREMILSSLLEMRHFLYTTNDTVAKSIYNKWTEIKQQLAFFYSNSSYRFANEIKKLEGKGNELEKELNRIADFKEQTTRKDKNWKAIQQSLKPGEASIEFAAFNYYNGKKQTDSTLYIALVLRKDRAEPQLVHLFEKKQLEVLLKKTGKNDYQGISKFYGSGKENDTLFSGSRLFQLIWHPLDSVLSGISKVFYTPAGLLHRIAFAGLPLNEKQLLSDKYKLVQLSTTASVIGLKSTILSAKQNLILYGGIAYNADTSKLKTTVFKYGYKNDIVSRSLPGNIERGNTWQDLPGTLLEITAIENLAKKNKFAVTTRSGIEANEESVKALNGVQSPYILHIATHGFFFADPVQEKKEVGIADRGSAVQLKTSDDPLMRSGLLLAGANKSWLSGKTSSGMQDGILTAYEVSNMYLPNTKLAVLSACETALGDIKGSEGVYGLQRAFKMAGVQSLIMSLWKVPDEETAEFMQLFYGNLFKRQTFSDAFYNTQTTMKNKYRNDPYRWAAFVLIQ